MPDKEHDPYRGVSGLVDDVDIVIEEATFTYDSDYNKGQTLIVLMTCKNEDDGEEIILKLSTGSGWEDDAKGRVAIRESGDDPKGFNRSCAYQTFFEHAMDCGAEDDIRSRGLPWEAKVWDGLGDDGKSADGGMRFHVNREAYKSVDGTDRDRLVPTAYLGIAGVEKAAKKAAPRKAAAPKKETTDDDATALPKKVELALKKIAGEVESHDDFVERAYAELDDADTYETVIMDDGDDGFFATHSE